jgi:hypothetical protein
MRERSAAMSFIECLGVLQTTNTSAGIGVIVYAEIRRCVRQQIIQTFEVIVYIVPQLLVVWVAAIRWKEAELFEIVRMKETTEAFQMIAGWFGEAETVGTEFHLEEASDSSCRTGHVKVHFKGSSRYQSSSTIAEFSIVTVEVKAVVHAYAMCEGVRP